MDLLWDHATELWSCPIGVLFVRPGAAVSGKGADDWRAAAGREGYGEGSAPAQAKVAAAETGSTGGSADGDLFENADDHMRRCFGLSSRRKPQQVDQEQSRANQARGTIAEMQAAELLKLQKLQERQNAAALAKKRVLQLVSKPVMGAADEDIDPIEREIVMVETRGKDAGKAK